MMKSGCIWVWRTMPIVTTAVICIVLLSLFGIEVAHSFISREYTLEEVLDACTNVAFGKVESIDGKKQRVIVKLGENLKGKSELSHIRINVAVGQKTKKTSPDMLMKKFKVGLPVIIFYNDKGTNLEGLGYVSGTWFQIFGTDNPNKNRVWWNFTHIEIYMHRTFSGSTEQFQMVVRATLAGEKWVGAGKGDVKALVLMGNGAPPVQGDVSSVGTVRATAEFLTLRKFNKVGRWKVAYQGTRDRNLSGLHEAQLLWVGVDEIGKDGYHLTKKAEDRIKSFVRRGGVVIVASQDSDAGKLCGNGWIPEPITGVDEDARRDFSPTKYAGGLFKSPNSVKPGTLRLDDTWTGWSSKYKILATTNAGKNIALATLQYGKGMYLVTALSNETQVLAKDNAPLMENIIHFSVKWLTKSYVKTLVLTGNGAPSVQGDVSSEFLALIQFSKVGQWRVVYQRTRDRNLSELHDAQILWIGVDEIGKDGYHLTKKAEDRIKSFVREGGVVIATSQDSDAGKLCGSGWVPEPITGVEEDARRDFEPTRYAGDIFKSPNSVKPGTLRLDDTWTGWSNKYKILATTNAGKNMALATLQYGKGMYLVTALNNESQAFVKDNASLIENIIHFSVKWLKDPSRSGRDVS